MARVPVEVYGQGTDGWTNGSGYPLAARLVLTAAHVVAPAGSPLVEIAVRDSEGDLRAAGVVWHNTDTDVALVEITDPEWPEPRWAHPVRWGRLVMQHAGPPVDIRGFPAVLATPAMRDRLDATGRIQPGSRAKAGLLAVDVDNPPASPDGAGSWWAGMSGAAVIEDGFIVGVAVEDPRGFDSRQLVATPITRVLADPAFRKLVERHCGHTPVAEPVELAVLAERVRTPRSPAGLLRADGARTPFRPRPEFDALVSWCHDKQHFSIRLVHGPGGQGKTRLARHLVGEMSGQGWAGVVLGDHATREQIGVLADVQTPTLVVVDYAEGRSAQLDAVIDALERAESPTRLLLLARTAGAWRTERVGPSPLLDDLADDTIVCALDALEPTPQGRVNAWREAVATFAGGLTDLLSGEWTAAAAGLSAPVLDGERYRTILAVQMDALARLLDAAQPVAVSTGGPEQVLSRHERHYWQRLALQYRVTLDPSRLEALVALVTLWGASTPADTEKLLAAAVPDVSFDQCVTIGGWLHTLYGDGEHHCAGIQPDRLAEHLIGTVLTAPAWRADLLGSTAAVTTPAQRERALTVLGRAAARHPALTGSIQQMLSATGADGAVAALQIATRLEEPRNLLVALEDFIVGANLDTLRLVDAALPRFSLTLAFSAMHVAAAMTERLRARVATERVAHLPDLAGSVNNLALRLGEAGRRAEGLTTAQEAVKLYRELVGLNRDAYLNNFAGSVNNLAIRLAEAGRRDEALTAAQEAVDLRRELVGLNRDAYLPALATSVNNLAIDLAEAGRRDEGLAAAQEAVVLRRELVGLNRDAYLPALAMSVNNLAVDLAEAGRRAEGLTTAQEAVKLYRELVGLNRDAYLPALAASVNNLAIRLAEAGRRDEGLAAAQEAGVLSRELVGLNRDAYLPDLAGSVNNLALRLGEAGRRDEGLTTAQEAVKLYRELVGLNRDAYLPNLATSLNNLALRLAEAGRRDEALTTAQEAVDLRRELVGLNHDAYLPNLATSVNNLALRLAKAGRRDEALTTAQEAVDLRRELAMAEPQRFEGAFAQSQALLNHLTADTG